MKDRFIITIDGPAGAGKTTIAKRVASGTGFSYIDTGAMYRALTLKFIRSGLSLEDSPELKKMTEDTDIALDFSGGKMEIYLDSEEVSTLIRSEEVTEKTSTVSGIAAVRDKLAGIQRQCAKKFKRAVFEGRDTGTVVFPDADLKIYLDAGIKERAKRRFEEIRNKGEKADLKKLQGQIKKRDYRDSSRGLAPLRVPEDAVIVDSTEMSIEQVVDKIVKLLDK